MIYLIDPKKPQYKANLHCHSTLSDGAKTPDELKEMYKSHGYSILAITDHERPHNHSRLSDGEFLMITGYENYIRPDPCGKSDAYKKEVHLNLFARDPENVKLVCFNESYSRYLKRDGVIDEQIRVGSERPRELTKEYVNEVIKTAKDNGYMVAYNHPYWSMEDEADIFSYEGLFSLEICNYGSYVMNYLEHVAPLYDKMLCRGQRIFCHAADDNHNHHPEGSLYCDSFGAFTMIIPEEFTYSGVIEAMSSGEMYASMGPIIKEVSVDGENLHIECSEAMHIFAYYGGKSPTAVHATDAQPITSADIKIDARARYVRVAVLDKEGRWANTRGYFRDEIGFPSL